MERSGMNFTVVVRSCQSKYSSTTSYLHHMTCKLLSSLSCNCHGRAVQLFCAALSIYNYRTKSIYSHDWVHIFSVITQDPEWYQNSLSLHLIQRSSMQWKDWKESEDTHWMPTRCTTTSTMCYTRTYTVASWLTCLGMGSFWPCGSSGGGSWRGREGWRGWEDRVITC